MSTAIKDYLGRSLGLLRRNTARVVSMEVDPRTPPLPIFTFSTPASASTSTSTSKSTSPPDLTDIKSLATGSDGDIGGLSTCSFTPVPSSSSSSSGESSQSHLAFHGNLSLKVPSAYSGRIRTGYAAFRTKSRPTLFGEETWDLGLYSHLRVVVGYRGWEGWRNRWVVNLQTDGPVRSDLFQHRLPLPPSSTSTSSRIPISPLSAPVPEFTTLHLPLSQFVLTNSGHTSQTQIPMMRNKVRTIGFGLLGGGRGEEEIPSSPSESSLSETGEMEGERAARERMVAGGWGRPEASEMDVELEELIRSDNESVVDRPGARSIGGGKYHQVGTPPVRVSTSVEGGTGVVEGSEGYYELCIKSVEAVKWDPEDVDEDLPSA